MHLLNLTFDSEFEGSNFSYRLEFLPLMKFLQMKNSNNKQPAFLDYVHELNNGMELSQALEHGLTQIDNIDLDLFKKIGLKTYAEGKWSSHKIFQHLIDWERIWCFRAIIFARQEGTIPVAHDQEIMGDHSNADELSIEHLIKELKIVRQSTMMMFDSFNKTILDTSCTFFEYEMPITDIGFSITAHQFHHFKVLEERYYPLGKE